MTEGEIQQLVKGVIETQVIQALKSQPDALEALVKSALSSEVGERSGEAKPNYYERKVPYLDYIAAEEIRTAARSAVRTVIGEFKPKIEAMIREGLQSESVVAALTKAFLGATEEEWKINVLFVGDKRSE